MENNKKIQTGPIKCNQMYHNAVTQNPRLNIPKRNGMVKRKPLLPESYRTAYLISLYTRLACGGTPEI